MSNYQKVLCPCGNSLNLSKTKGVPFAEKLVTFVFQMSTFSYLKLASLLFQNINRFFIFKTTTFIFFVRSCKQHVFRILKQNVFRILKYNILVFKIEHSLYLKAIHFIVFEKRTLFVFKNSIDHGVNIGFDRCFYVALIMMTRFNKGCLNKKFY